MFSNRFFVSGRTEDMPPMIAGPNSIKYGKRTDSFVYSNGIAIEALSSSQNIIENEMIQNIEPNKAPPILSTSEMIEMVIIFWMNLPSKLTPKTTSINIIKKDRRGTNLLS